MSADPWEDLLQQGGDDPWESLLAGASQPKVGVTLEGLDTERAAAEQGAFKPWSGPDQIPLQQQSSAGAPQWSGDVLDTLADTWARASNAMYFGYGDEGVGALMGDQARDNVRNRMQLAKERSPTASIAGDIGGSAVPAVAAMAFGGGGAMAALPFSGRLAAGAGLGAEQAALSAAGYADDGDRGQAALDALPLGAVLGAGGEALATGAQGAGNWMRETAAPWMRQQGLMNRVASSGLYGGSMDRLAQNRGGKEGVAELGQWMENNGLEQWTPGGIGEEAQSLNSMWQGDQRNFLDELAQNPNAYPVDTGGVSQDLVSRGYEQSALAADSAKTQGGQYIKAADNLSAAAPNGSMDFETAWRNRQAFDQGAQWNAGPNGDEGLAAVNRDAANGLRGGLVESLENTSPELAPRWEGIQENLGNSKTIADAGLSRDMRETGNQPVSLPSLIGAAGGGLPGMAAAAMVKTGGRAGLANVERGGSQALDWLGSQGDSVAAGMQVGGRTAGEHYGENEGVKNSRGYLLPQAAQQLMQEPGSLGPYEKQFFDAANSPDTHALSALITKLSHTDPQFRQSILPKLQQLTAAEY